MSVQDMSELIINNAIIVNCGTCIGLKMFTGCDKLTTI
jgi:hypothetical protein